MCAESVGIHHSDSGATLIRNATCQPGNVVCTRRLMSAGDRRSSCGTVSESTDGGIVALGHTDKTQSWARIVLAAYGVTLALIAMWPVPVDGGAGPFLAAITRMIPWATYPRIEFGANIVLFVPLGFLLLFLLPRARYIVMPITVVVSVGIELVQALALEQRTPSVMDIVANVTGACVGMLIAHAVERAWVSDRPHPRQGGSEGAPAASGGKATMRR